MYFRTNLFADIENLKNYAGIHRKPFKPYYRLLSKKFPFAIFYKVENATVFIHRFWTAEKIRLGFGIDLNNLVLVKHHPVSLGQTERVAVDKTVFIGQAGN